ncbi:MAG: DUF86 domain-containing protein [Agathobaculum desmolans]|uniref:HepT-like ribonuclease domain-containing protein n=1 Tax=Agathobaculum desmolans TaxID=39484 RepID=UPI0039950597
MKKPDQERLKKIISIWTELQSEMVQHEITKDKLMSDQFSQWAVTTPLYNIGEHVYQLSKELKKEYSEIPWNMVSGLRHRLVHDYDGINWSFIVDVIFDDIDPFVQEIRKILQHITETRM